MKKSKIEQLATSQLVTYQQIIGLANEQMDQFATDMVEFAQKKRVSERFAKDMENELQPKVEANNVVLSQIEAELYKRIKKDFKEVSLPNTMPAFFKRFHEEVNSHKKLMAEVMKSVTTPNLEDKNLKEDKPVVSPNFKIDE